MVTEHDLSHLLAHIQSAALLPDEERIDLILSDRWISYTRAIQAVDKIAWLYRHPKKLRMPNLLLVGPTNNGKTMITAKARRDHAPQTHSDPGIDEKPIVYVQTPNIADTSRFYTALLNELEAPNRPTDKIVKKEQQALTILRKVNTRMLIIDEIHNILAGPSANLGQMLNLLRYLGNELQIPIVAVGVKAALQAIHSDDQLANRFEPFPLPRWQPGPELNNLLITFEKTIPLRRPSDLVNPVFAKRLLAMSEGILGEIVSLITRAAELAVRTGVETIDVKTLEALDYQSPSQRHKSAVGLPVE